jgi:hypothetical protein
VSTAKGSKLVDTIAWRPRGGIAADLSAKRSLAIGNGRSSLQSATCKRRALTRE